MLKPQLYQSESSRSLMLLQKPFVSGHVSGRRLPSSSPPSLRRKQKNCSVRAVSNNDIKVVAAGTPSEKSVTVKVVVTVQLTLPGVFSNIGLDRALDDITDFLGKTLLLELVSADLDSRNGLEKETIKGYAQGAGREENEVKYESKMVVPEGFGEVGGVLVENEHHKEIYLKSIVIDGFHNGPIHITCNSFVHSNLDNKEKRIFFTNKSYVPRETPSGLKRVRQRELEILRGDGQGERQSYDRIYDYDTYNDLGNPDKSADLARPVLGGPHHPYPRRCRTGRPRCDSDPLSEKRSGSVYVPRDEVFSGVKRLNFSTDTVKSVAHALLPSLETALINADLGFPYFTAIDSLFNEGLTLPKPRDQGWLFTSLLPRLVKALSEGEEELLRFEVPETINRDKFSWLRDEEFSRQTLAGLNPFSLQLVKEWPLKSKLDPEIYGPAESAITKEIIERAIKGVMTVDEAIERKKLFILDYHDLLLPYVHKVREIEGTTLYGSRTLFMLSFDNTLRPLAIELTRPPIDDKPMWRQVFSPDNWDSTSCWLWKLAKAHVCAHDSGFHQLTVHWLRTHCCTEPYIIAANRQLSAMHPIYRLLLPHFRYTMEINALARAYLINAGGIIESGFSPEKYSMEISSAYYDKYWRFDMEALPADLIRRGMAVEDPTAEHGLRLTIEDYPFANDGLLLWDALKQWVSDYVNHYYSKASYVESDEELQAWWNEVRTKGHGDKKDEPWWPTLKTQIDLIQVVTTIVWVASGHHAAVNFGQYHYAGYFPNRPSIARTNMPTEEPSEEEFRNFLAKPESALLKCFPSQIQATKIMAILDILSNHSVDEEYLGDVIEPAWSENPVINAAFDRFNGKLKEIEGIVDARNVDLNLKNRCGAGVVPYELLKPFSKSGVTGMGVPYSISI